MPLAPRPFVSLAVLLLILACGESGGTLNLPGKGGDLGTDAQPSGDGVAAVDSTTPATDPGGGNPGTDPGTPNGQDVPPTSDPGGGIDPPISGDISLRAADKTRIQGVYDPAEGGAAGPAVLLVHGYQSDLFEWDAFVPALRERGYHVLRIDLRGHGRSDPYEKVMPLLLNDPEATPQDVAAGLEWLAGRPEVDGARIGIVGTNIGANLAFVAMSKDAARAGVAVSPRDSAVAALAGVSRVDALKFGPVFCVAAEEDGGGAQKESCEDLQFRTGEPNPVEIVPESDAHGHQLLVQEEVVWGKVLDFLDEAVAGK